MSYWVYLRNEKGNLCQIDKHQNGGTFVLGGTTDAELNVTYNYGGLYRDYLDKNRGLKWLHNKKAEDTIKRLEFAIIKLGTIRNSDYWNPTKGNAGYALSILASWAKMNPKGIWEVN